jgi:hypothetical protein
MSKKNLNRKNRGIYFLIFPLIALFLSPNLLDGNSIAHADIPITGGGGGDGGGCHDTDGTACSCAADGGSCDSAGGPGCAGSDGACE